jgi:hypothetical protein
MKPSASKPTGRASRQANARIIALVVVFFLLGIAGSALWFRRAAPGGEHPPSGAGPAPLSAATLAVLQHLNVPIEIRFYVLLDPATVPDSVRAFAGRVDQLLAQYQQAANGRVKVTRCDPTSNATANAAVADGLKPFNQDKGDACFLGLALQHDKQKEALPQLSTDWEPALESDLSRAIARLNDTAAALKPAAAPPPIDAMATEEVKRALPNFSTLSVEDGTKALRQSALDELTKAAQEMDVKIKDAQQRFLDAQKNHSSAEEAAAQQQLVRLQAEQTERLKQIIARSQARVEAFQRLKAGGQ